MTNVQAIHIRVDDLPDVVEAPDTFGGTVIMAGNSRVYRRPGSVAKLAEQCGQKAAEMYALADYLRTIAETE